MRKKLTKSTLPILILTMFLAGSVQTAAAQVDDIVRTVFCIGNVNTIGTYPLNAFSVNDNELLLAETWRAQPHGVGPVGLAVDPIAEHLYVTYEGENFIEAFDARDATPLTTINLAGTANLAGIDVRVGDGLLYVVDRGQTTLWVFDSDTFLPVENWPLSGLGGSGAFDLEVIEHWDGRDVIFVSNGAPDVHYYDLDTQEHLGHYDMSREAASMTVDNSSGTPVVFAAAAASGTPSGHSFLLKYDVATDTTDQINLGGNGRGVSVNPPLGLVYVSVGVLLAGNIRVYDQETLTEQNRYSLQGSPTDTESSQLAFGSSVKKEIINESANAVNGPGEFDQGEDIIFEITLTNKRDVDIHFMPLTDIYDITQLTYISSTLEPLDSNDDGELDWTDMIAVIGHDLGFEEEYTFEVTFRAEPDECERFVNGTNIMQMHDAIDARDEAIEDASGTADYKIWCTCITDEDCDDGVFCNGPETCENRQCLHAGNPCPVSDDIFCNGPETLECVEETQSCGHAGDPCVDDNDMCNGDEVCDEEAQSCAHSGDPCEDDGTFCNGDDYCDPTKLECQHTGDPCEEDEECDEEADLCIGGNNPVGGDEDDAGWPEGKVTGGCCGCE